MKQDRIVIVLIFASILMCSYKLSVLSNRINNIITLQQSQQKSIDKCFDRDCDLLLKLGRIENKQ